MRNAFPWYFDRKPADYKELWANSTLTVDANVLLDLYRYHESTRESILSAMESFAGRFWISHQTAREFLKNRKRVITDVDAEYQKAKNYINDIDKLVDETEAKFYSARLISEPTTKKISKALKDAIKLAHSEISDAINKSPDFSKADTIFYRLEKLISNNIGTEPTDLDARHLEAKRRQSSKTPPGYMDAQKDGNESAGDYVMWSEIIDYAKQSGKPIIFVTSEQKEDWWERKSGKTLGPRLELLEESYKKTGATFVIYQTERFLEYHQEFSGGKKNKSAIEEIARVLLNRTPAVTATQEVSHQTFLVSRGIIRVNLSRSVRNFTGSGRFSPPLASPPNVRVQLSSRPEGTPPVIIRANTGTNHDFNVHVHSADRDIDLPQGDYELSYEASCDDIFG
jgi:hypothetical protein